ncbi:MAG: glutamate--tRNA ligase [Planctomycetaceae bacterium]
MSVRTRFAPSPTGYMHIGGMRTALFNWLWARRHGGTFILRIDDTDQQRNVDEALGPILEAFRWLGLNWDEGPEVGGSFGPYFQSQRRSLHDAALQQLLDSGRAYRDFETAEETRLQREAAERDKRVYVSSRVSAALTPEEVDARLAAGEAFVVRLLVPRERRLTVKDLVRGDVEFDCSLMPDPVIARGDGSPLYNFASAVDDAQMQITHVIRAEEHLSNTPVQVLIHEALGNELPQFAHIPFVAAPASKKKLSKRDIGKYRNQAEFRRLFQLGDEVLTRLGIDPTQDSVSPVMVEYYREVGFLPAGVLNALSRLGWSLDDETEILSLQTVTENFSLDRVVKSPAGLDPDKLMSYQAHWMGQLSTEAKVNGCVPFLVKAKLIPESCEEAVLSRVRRVIELTADRLRVFGDILSMDEFFVADDAVVFDEKNFQKRLVQPTDAVDLLRELRRRLADAGDFTAASLHDLVQAFVDERGIKFGAVAPALRLAVTGKMQGADLFPTLELLGRDSCLKRIDRAFGIAEAAGR